MMMMYGEFGDVQEEVSYRSHVLITYRFVHLLSAKAFIYNLSTNRDGSVFTHLHGLRFMRTFL